MELKDYKEVEEKLFKQISSILPESDMYGCGQESFFTEFWLAYDEDIGEIRVGSGDLIEAIQVKYKSKTGALHGGDGGNMESIKLTDDERITAVSGTLLKATGGNLLSSLTFSTDYGREVTFGKGADQPDHERFHFQMYDGAYLAAIKGYDAFSKEAGATFPGLKGNNKLLPAIGFIQKM